jgi:hypothetical protein
MAYAVATANRSWAATPDRKAALQKDLGDTDSHRYSQILSDTAVGIQTADNEPATDVDLTDTFIYAAVRTISGQQGVAIQLLDQSPIAFGEIIFRDLTDAVAVKRVQGHRGRPQGRHHPDEPIAAHEPDRSHPGGGPGGDQLRRRRATSPGPASRVRGWPCNSLDSWFDSWGRAPDREGKFRRVRP